MGREKQGYWRVSGGPLISMRLWFTPSPWRLGAAWAVMAGALASHGLTWQTWDWARLLLLVFLADPVWGGMWALLAEHQRTAWKDDDLLPPAVPALPYLRPGSPAARLLGWAESDRSLVATWRLGLPGLLAALLVALILGWEAVLATALAFALCFAGWATRRLNGQPDMWAQALLTIGLPWALGHLAYAPLNLLSAGSALAFVVWQYAALGIEHGRRRAWWLLGLAQGAVIVILVIGGHPLWAAGVSLVSMPTWWTVVGARSAAWGSDVMTRVQVWWWLALLASGWALGGPLE